MKLILKDGTNVEVSNFAYGMNNIETQRMEEAGIAGAQIANINVIPDSDSNIQRQVKSLCTLLTTDNISEVSINDGDVTRTYTFTKCLCCQSIMSEGRDYIYIQLID